MIFIHDSEAFRRFFGCDPPLDYFQGAEVWIIDIAAPDDLDREFYLDSIGGE